MKKILLLLIFYTSQLISQETDNSLSLEQSIALALENYPSIKEAFAKELASQSGIDLAKTSYLPKLDLLWQANRSTYNNITGSIFPQHVVPTLSVLFFLDRLLKQHGAALQEPCLLGNHLILVCVKRTLI